MAEVGMEFQGLSRRELDHLFEAEKQLRLAGIHFDTGYSFGSKTRVWELDWSLKGARIVLKTQKIDATTTEV